MKTSKVNNGYLIRPKKCKVASGGRGCRICTLKAGCVVGLEIHGSSDIE